MRLSGRRADTGHHYGHGKIENLSARFETALLLVTSGWIIYEAIQRLLFKSVEVEVSAWAFVVMVVSITIDATRSRVLYRAAKKYNSQALEADALHFVDRYLELLSGHHGIDWCDAQRAYMRSLLAQAGRCGGGDWCSLDRDLCQLRVRQAHRQGLWMLPQRGWRKPSRLLHVTSRACWISTRSASAIRDRDLY